MTGDDVHNSLAFRLHLPYAKGCEEQPPNIPEVLHISTGHPVARTLNSVQRCRSFEPNGGDGECFDACLSSARSK